MAIFGSPTSSFLPLLPFLAAFQTNLHAYKRISFPSPPSQKMETKQKRISSSSVRPRFEKLWLTWVLEPLINDLAWGLFRRCPPNRQELVPPRAQQFKNTHGRGERKHCARFPGVFEPRSYSHRVAEINRPKSRTQGAPQNHPSHTALPTLPIPHCPAQLQHTCFISQH